MTIAVPTDWTPRGLGHNGLDPLADPLPTLAERLEARKQKLGAFDGGADSDNSDLVTILDQGQSEACLWHAGAQEIHACFLRQGIASPVWPSIALLWAQGRQYENTFPKNVGNYPSTLPTIVKTLGFARVDQFPWTGDFSKHPGLVLDREEFDQRALAAVDWAAVGGRADLDTLLQHRYLVRWGGPVTGAFQRGEFDPKAAIDAAVRDIIGNHAMIICGKRNGLYRFANSWSPWWGDAGFCWATPEFVDSGLDSSALIDCPYFLETP